MQDLTFIVMNILSIPDKIIHTYVLLISTSNIVAKYAESKLIREGITPTQHAVLITLITAGCPLKLTELSNRLFRSKNSLTTVIDHMERDGLVERQAIPNDRRAINICVTNKGNALLEGSKERSRELVYQSMACLNEAEINTLNNLLQKIRSNMLFDVPGDSSTTKE